MSISEDESSTSYDIGLQNVLSDPELVMLFRDFLKGSFSSENLAFIVEVENFKGLWNQGAEDEVIKKRAQEIFDKYFMGNSQYELNIPGPLLEELREKMKNPATTVFNKVQKSVFKLVETDSYPRFIKTEGYKRYIDEHKKKKKEKMFGIFHKKPKKKPFSRLQEELNGNHESPRSRSSTVVHLQEFFETRSHPNGGFQGFEDLSKATSC